ncbi:hypothetical protein K461DRAFT_273597 [Myriangium duriaei CBS 260.36]|uniref:Zn(2)-C6 fungal-type domain-containing protein n=1 Tax=Myriangium duriaei CBS 260.36 TaxID=1168546 RepID=A0A9P4MSD5_9PEZI|nr:hypothetical protein K461DRAFT_273597 [Myriangium duriaei CBS 260.36]
MAATDASPPPPVPEVKSSTTASAAPRKRRRRTAASGAAEDCFTCRRRATQCDRKRPYCTQCLEAGKECSGYRTTLTWGVGVASRGKLRGLSCPVAVKGSPAQVEVKSEHPPPVHRRKTSTSSNISNASGSDISGQSAPTSSAFTFSTSLPPVHESQPIKIEHPRQHINAPPALRLDIPRVPSGWPGTRYGSSDMMRSEHMHRASISSTTSARIGMPMMSPYIASPSHDSPFPGSAQSVAAFSDGGYMTPHDFPPTPFGFHERMPSYPYSASETIPQSLDSTVLTSDVAASYTRGSPPFNTGSPHFNSGSPQFNNGSPQSIQHGSVAGFSDLPSHVEQQEQRSIHTEVLTPQDLQSALLPSHDDVFQQFEMTMDEMMGVPDQSEDTIQQTDLSLTLTRPIFATQFFHLSHRMQSLLDFYDKHICSVLVAFDGNANPYRAHILNLAAHNEGLQNAIAALATNNIRMRSQKQLQSTGFVRELEENGADALSESRLALSAPTPEESCYKALSIEQLNMQLAHPSSAEDDAVLATLLVLCLFHVCDSGFSKFKTQLAGVQKLLSLRGSTAQSGFIGWVQMFFTWFDVMSSTVNDREVEIHNSSLDMLDFSTDLGALEEFSGCDGRLFKLIARLGRLNLLAQQRPVRSKDGSMSSYQNEWRRTANRMKPRALNPDDFYHLDGNGWSTPLDDYNDDLFNPASIYPDHRTEFWVEWHDIRSRLQSWSMDYSAIPGPSGGSEGGLGPEQRDLVHINESFRSSALLYTERLANPDLPSHTANFQQLVAQGLFHITALSITSCVNKFLLWPLFIIGTECVEAQHRATIRARCVEVQRESGFFNNLSVLEVLERAWRDPVVADNTVPTPRFGAGPAQCPPDAPPRQPFRWRNAMSRVDGEYIVV